MNNKRETPCPESKTPCASSLLSQNISCRRQSFFVGCRPSGGRLHPRLRGMETIFFYEEFWRNVPVGVKKRLRTQLLGANCRNAAATQKTAPERTKPAMQ